jgi:hypothetical protein
MAAFSRENQEALKDAQAETKVISAPFRPSQILGSGPSDRTASVKFPRLDSAMTSISVASTTRGAGESFAAHASGTEGAFGRTLCRLWVVGTLLWIASCSVVIYQAYREPHDLWLILDPADVDYAECWLNVSRQPARRNVGLSAEQPGSAAPGEEAARIRRVAACYRAINQIDQTTTRRNVLTQGALTTIAVPLLVFVLGWLLLSFTSYPQRTGNR